MSTRADRLTNDLAIATERIHGLKAQLEHERATLAALQQRCAIMREFIANCGIGEVRFPDGSVMTQAAALAQPAPAAPTP